MARLFGLFGEDKENSEVMASDRDLVEDTEFAEDEIAGDKFDDVEFADEVVVEDDEDVEFAAESAVVTDKELLLRKEELDISKNVVQTGEVVVHKDVVSEEKTVHVPVTHEQVVIERRVMNEPSDKPIGEEEVLRIPVTEERVQVGKHTVVTGAVEVSKRTVAETHEVKETVRREEARVDVDGHPDVINKVDSGLH